MILERLERENHDCREYLESVKSMILESLEREHRDLDILERENHDFTASRAEFCFRFGNAKLRTLM